MARKKLTFTPGGQPAHRACQSAPDRPPTRAAATPGPARAPKDISRAELLKRIEALRKRDPKMNLRAKKAQPGGRPKPPPTAPRRNQRPVAPPQPYYGVEMKSLDGRWVQMHPDSE
ncbi:hypothetical protein ABZ208_17385 [Streptomyces sp. NPDC006208]|uniref:hypothetical protein n=1 Tax=Streptomyces sp. NPDC006208 TaxID=3156734 RepID=UPI0033BB5563